MVYKSYISYSYHTVINQHHDLLYQPYDLVVIYKSCYTTEFRDKQHPILIQI